MKYADEEGNEIHDPQTISGSKGDVYDASTDQYKLVLDGYTLDTSKLPQNSIGNFEEALQTITYVYSKNPLVAADLTVRYVDIENNPISEDIILQGNIGENYYTDKKILNIILKKKFKEIHQVSFQKRHKQLLIYTKKMSYLLLQ